MRRCRLNGSDAPHCEDRSGVDPVKRCTAFFVSPVDASVPVERVGRAALRRSFRRRSRKALHRFLRFTRVKTLKPGSAAAVWAPDVGPPRETLTPAPGIGGRMVTDARLALMQVSRRAQ